ncbi:MULTISPECIES: MauE/DoxX family redox-associated membrane protein [Nonomuraea]|uniref:MauE/DoxX family redox-associated membrane protein n=1 Tax=Nonomuraea TaxID=83681 RepID=UPI0027E13ED3|nr:MauE/DoxX family redox-associated membrane protein [Nonomuraea ceibae]
MLASQVPVLIVLLVLGTVAKFSVVRSGREPGELARLGPAVLMPGRLQQPALLLCGVVELVLAAGLLVSAHPLFRWGTVTFFALSTYVLLELRRRRPDAGCGCFGEVSSAPVGLRSIGRTVVLTGMALMAVWAGTPGWTAFAEPAWGFTLAGAAVLAVLSPEIDELVDRARHRAPCEQRRGPQEGVSLARLKSSGTWRAHAAQLAATEPYDSWRELCWRFFAFQNHERDDVVFAVHLAGRRPAVRVAVVSAESLPEYTTVSA